MYLKSANEINRIGPIKRPEALFWGEITRISFAKHLNTLIKLYSKC